MWLNSFYNVFILGVMRKSMKVDMFVIVLNCIFHIEKQIKNMLAIHNNLVFIYSQYVI